MGSDSDMQRNRRQVEPFVATEVATVSLHQTERLQPVSPLTVSGESIASQQQVASFVLAPAQPAALLPPLPSTAPPNRSAASEEASFVPGSELESDSTSELAGEFLQDCASEFEGDLSAGHAAFTSTNEWFGPNCADGGAAADGGGSGSYSDRPTDPFTEVYAEAIGSDVGDGVSSWGAFAEDSWVSSMSSDGAAFDEADGARAAMPLSSSAPDPSDAKPFNCSVVGCTFRAARQRYVADHMKTHTGFKPHKCPHPGCGYATAATGHLNRHKRQVHTEQPVAGAAMGAALAAAPVAQAAFERTIAIADAQPVGGRIESQHLALKEAGGDGGGGA